MLVDRLLKTTSIVYQVNIEACSTSRWGKMDVVNISFLSEDCEYAAAIIDDCTACWRPY